MAKLVKNKEREAVNECDTREIKFSIPVTCSIMHNDLSLGHIYRAIFKLSNIFQFFVSLKTNDRWSLSWKSKTDPKSLLLAVFLELLRMGAMATKTSQQGLKHCTLWKADRSPACRAVMMAVDSLNLSITEVDLNMDKGEHRAPEILALNPLQTLPIFKDRELVLNDSHAICAYLASRYCESNRILPKDPGGRSKVDQHLHYNSGVVYPRFRAAAYPILYENCNFIMPQQILEIECAYSDLERMLVGQSWFGGSWATLSDIVFASSVSTLNILIPIDKQRFPRLSSWLHRVSDELFFVTANRKGLSEFSRRIGELAQVQQS